jgi:hypothetical protein
MKSSTWNVLAASALFALAGWIGVSSTAYGEPQEKPAARADEKATQDLIIFHDGRQLLGKVTQGATTVHFKGLIAGIEAEMDYPKSDILTIRMGSKADPAASTTPTPKTATPAPAAAAQVADDGVGKKNIYWVELKGVFGEDISQTPIRSALKDAKANKADVIVMTLDAEWKRDPFTPLGNDSANFDEIFRAEPMAAIFQEEIPREWTTQPKVVFWVKTAMGGASLLPFICPNIYFQSEGRMGGLGNLSFIFEGVGDDVVREKQRSLRLGHAEGWAIAGGYDYRLVRAMARMEYVLSMRWVDGKVELFEGYPSNPGEELLTDDGKDEHADSLRERVDGSGNDVLTLDARKAKALGVSKGTVDSDSELITALGLDRTGVVVPGRSKQIMKDWSDGLDNAKRKIVRLLTEGLRDAMGMPQTTYAERTKSRGAQQRIIEEVKGLLDRWGEGLTPRWRGQNRIPDEATLNSYIEKLKLDQMKDKK